MKIFVENELKLLIPKETYQDLFQEAVNHQAVTVIQTNHYFDTLNYDISGKKLSLRIREKNNQYTLTLKVGRKANGQSQSSDEYNKTIEEEQALAVINGFLPMESLLSDLPVKEVPIEGRPLLHMGQMTTKRTIYAPIPGLHPLELDQNDYLGIQDYELEWEYNQEEQVKAILDWLKQHHIQPESLKSRSKFGRFMERLIALKEHSLP